MNFHSHDQCILCGQPQMMSRSSAVLDVWPAGLNGVIARTRWHLAGIAWRRAAATTYRATTEIVSWSVALGAVICFVVAVAGDI